MTERDVEWTKTKVGEEKSFYRVEYRSSLSKSIPDFVVEEVILRKTAKGWVHGGGWQVLTGYRNRVSDKHIFWERLQQTPEEAIAEHYRHLQHLYERASRARENALEDLERYKSAMKKGEVRVKPNKTNASA